MAKASIYNAKLIKNKGLYVREFRQNVVRLSD